MNSTQEFFCNQGEDVYELQGTYEDLYELQETDDDEMHWVKNGLRWKPNKNSSLRPKILFLVKQKNVISINDAPCATYVACTCYTEP